MKIKSFAGIAQMVLVAVILSLTLITTNIFSATCTGADPCHACKNCKYCKHCAKEGGKCGVCK
jgi:hypothetical protein